MTEESGYKRTFFDRHGPDAGLRVKSFSYALMTLALVISAGMLAGAPIELTLMLGVPLSLLAGYGSWYLGKAAGNVAEYVMAGGSSTPYEEQFSQQQALVMQSRYVEALELFEQQIAAMPGEPRVRVAAADLYATHGKDPKRAAVLYREVQRIPGLPPGQDIYVTNKLADLYLGPLKEPGRALVEFRKLASRYPNSVAAKNAQLAIANLKPQIVQGAQGAQPDVWERPADNSAPPPNTPGMPGF